MTFQNIWMQIQLLILQWKMLFVTIKNWFLICKNPRFTYRIAGNGDRQPGQIQDCLVMIDEASSTQQKWSYAKMQNSKYKKFGKKLGINIDTGLEKAIISKLAEIQI